MNHTGDCMRFATVGGVTLHYTYDRMKGVRPLVFINALGTDLRIWNEVIPAFAQEHSLIRFDMRGQGLSDCPPPPYSIRNLTDDLAGLLDQLEVKTAVLIGISVGGLVAMNFAVTYPQRVKALVLCDTATKIGTASLWNDRITALPQHGMESVAESILARWFAPSFAAQHPVEYRGYYNLLNRAPLDGYIKTYEVLRDTDLADVVGSIKC